jgi:hypothetical protein
VSKPEAKTVLKRTFTRRVDTAGSWECNTTHGVLSFWWSPGAKAYIAALAQNEDEPDMVRGEGPTETDAILALQSQLRKMAELEVVE